MKGLAILLAFNLLGVALHAIGVPLPGNVLGLILFTLCLFLGVVKLAWVEEAAELLLRHMLLFFAPVVVGVIVYRDRIAREWPAMTAGVIGSLLVTMLVTGWVATWLLGKRRGAR
jgi:holin-like protein